MIIWQEVVDVKPSLNRNYGLEFAKFSKTYKPPWNFDQILFYK